MKDDGYMKNLAGYITYIFQGFETYIRTEVDLVEGDIRLVLDEYSSSFITYELQPGVYILKDLSEALFNILQSEYPGPSNLIVNEIDDISIKTKLVVRDMVLSPLDLLKNRFLVMSLVLLQVGIISTILSTLPKKL